MQIKNNLPKPFRSSGSLSPQGKKVSVAILKWGMVIIVIGVLLTVLFK